MTTTGDTVLVIEDCRPGAPATGQTGTYEGEFPRSVMVVYRGKNHEFDYDRWISGAVKFSDGTAAIDGIPEWKDGESRPAEDCWFVELNPRIRLADGSAIWGDECWWGDAATAPATLSEAQTELEQHKILLRAMASALATEEK
jgi:hypothetical protein